jgi:deoxyribodipyrimidine photo-lyase
MKSDPYKDANETLLAINPIKYQATRNYIGGSTRLSVYIARGVLTLPQIKDYLLKNYTKTESYKLINELAWREYMQREWQLRGNDIFDDIKSKQEFVESADLPINIINAQTGIEALDTGIKELYETGYVDNHMRMWLAGLICNIAHTKWQKPAVWMYYHLLDGDPASNFLSWQWVAGTFSSKRYLPSQENINKYTKTNQNNTFLDLSYEELATIKTPLILKERIDENLIWVASKSTDLIIDKSKPTVLYHSFWLNKYWRNEISANRILVLEPNWFEKFPVSQKVTDSILEIAGEIAGLQIYVGNIDELLPHLGKEIYYMSHPSVSHWPGHADQMPLLFPEVPFKSYDSFSAFWKQCQKFY